MEENKTQGIQFKLPQDKTEHLIKVIGVGGGGGNAVRSMYERGVKNVSFAYCNTDSQALANSPIPVRVQLGEEGLGVGGNPEKGRAAAEESIEDVNRLFDDGTKMVFLTAGMGGGTGTGAAPLIAKTAREKGILTVGVVTLPFRFEKRARIENALVGVEELKKNVDSLLVINNERLLEIYSDTMLSIVEGFSKANDILTVATKTVSEVITIEGIINRDFKDVETVMKDGGGAIVTVGYGSGEKRVIKAMNDALNSPLLNTKDIEKAQRLLYIIYTCDEKPVSIPELGEINQFMDSLSDDLEVLWGLYHDDTIGEQVKVAVVATGFDKEREQKKDIEDKSEAIKRLWKLYYPDPNASVHEEPEPQEEPNKEEPSVEILDSEVKDTDTNLRGKGQSWLNRFVNFVKSTLEE